MTDLPGIVRDPNPDHTDPEIEGDGAGERSIVDRLRRAGQRARQAVVIDLPMTHLKVDEGWRAMLRMGLPSKAGTSMTAQGMLEALGSEVPAETHLEYLASGARDLVLVDPDGTEEAFGAVLDAARAFSGRDDIPNMEEALAALFTVDSPPVLHLPSLTQAADYYRAEVLTMASSVNDVEGR